MTPGWGPAVALGANIGNGYLSNVQNFGGCFEGFCKSKKFHLHLMPSPHGHGHNRPIAVPKAEVEPRGGFWQLPCEFQPNTT